MFQVDEGNEQVGIQYPDLLCFLLLQRWSMTTAALADELLRYGLEFNEETKRVFTRMRKVNMLARGSVKLKLTPAGRAFAGVLRESVRRRNVTKYGVPVPEEEVVSAIIRVGRLYHIGNDWVLIGGLSEPAFRGGWESGRGPDGKMPWEFWLRVCLGAGNVFWYENKLFMIDLEKDTLTEVLISYCKLMGFEDKYQSYCTPPEKESA